MILTGLARLGRDCEVRHTSSGEAVTNLSLAWNYGKKVDGQQPTQWLEAALWGKRAEALAQYLKKGGVVDVVVGDVHVEQDEAKQYPPKLVGRVIELEFAGGNKSDQPSGQTDHGRAKADGYAPEPKPVSKQSFDDLEDSIPF